MSHEITEVIEQHGKAVNEFKARTDDRLGKVESQLSSIDSAITELSQKSAATGFCPDGGDTNPLSAIGKSAEVKAFAADRSMKSANVPLTGSLTEIKSVVGDVAGSGNDLYSVQPQRAAGIRNVATRRLSIFDVLPRLQVGSNSFQFNALDGYSNAATYQSKEGAGKTQGALPTELVTAPVMTVAHFLKLSEQVLADAPALQQQVSSLLAYGVLAKASAEIIAGSTAGKIQGLATQATAFTATVGSTLADAIGQAATALDIAGWNADTVILHPSDLFAIRSERTTDGYVASGWIGGSEQTVWGLRAVADPSVTAGSPIVLDSTQTAILDRMQTRVEFGRSGDDMVNNLITALAEARVGLAVFAPSAVLKVSIATE